MYQTVISHNPVQVLRERPHDAACLCLCIASVNTFPSSSFAEADSQTGKCKHEKVPGLPATCWLEDTNANAR